MMRGDMVRPVIEIRDVATLVILALVMLALQFRFA